MIDPHPVALTIAGSDSGGGAGIQADLKTFHRFGVFGTSVLTLVTAQNTTGVSAIQVLSPELVTAQLRAVLDDFPPAAAKTGALGSATLVHAIAERAREFAFPLVVDPVALSKQGSQLLDQDGLLALKNALIPLATVVTPNLHEASALAGFPVDTIDRMRDAAQAIAQLGARSVLVKGGHLVGDAVDILWHADEFHEFRAARIATQHTHGTGCTYSAAITAGLAHGLPLVSAIHSAKEFVTRAIETNPGLGKAAGPLNHWA